MPDLYQAEHSTLVQRWGVGESQPPRFGYFCAKSNASAALQIRDVEDAVPYAIAV